MTREKKTKSGKLLEIDFFPITDDGKKLPTRAAKSKISTEAQAKYNKAMSVKKFVRLVNANFDDTDYIMHPTYRDDLSPQDEESAKKDIANYMRRAKRKRDAEAKKTKEQLAEAKKASEEMPGNKFLRETVKELKAKLKKLSAPFKYAYVIEEQIYKTGERKGKSRFHFHLFCTGGLDFEVMEAMWKNGARTNCDTFQPERFGPEAAAKYMQKDPRGNKRFVCSKNMEKPKVRNTDGKISARTVEKMAKERIDDAAYWEARYKGYRFLRCFARVNPYNGQWYVSAVMYRSDSELPKWEIDEWQTEDIN